MQELMNILFMKTLNKLHGERYLFVLPFKLLHKPLPDNYTSKHRLSLLKTKPDKNEELKQEYNQVFDNYLKNFIIETVGDDDYGVVEKPITCPNGQLFAVTKRRQRCV